MTQPLRVAMIGLRAPWGTSGGVERSVAALAPRLVRRGCEVTVYCRSRYNPYGSCAHQGVKLVDVQTLYTPHLEAFVHTARVAPAAARRADVVHVHAMGPSLFSWIPRLMGAATVATVHGLDWQRDKWGPFAAAVLRAGEWSAARWPHRLITVGMHLEAHFQQVHGVSPITIPNGVDLIEPVDLDSVGFGDLSHRGYLLALGRLVPEKGLDDLLGWVAQAGTGLPLIVVGEGTHTPAYVARLHEIAGPDVRFVGARYGAERDALLSHAAALVHPSRMEGFPLVPLEAMAAGTPVLLSQIPPHEEQWVAGAGWCVARESDAWVQALRQVAELGTETLDIMGAVGRDHAAKHWGWDGVAARTHQVYLDAVKHQQG